MGPPAADLQVLFPLRQLRSLSDDANVMVIDQNLELLLSGKFADLKIRCKGFDFDVHKAIVCRLCPFFDRAWGSGFKESVTNMFELPEDYPGIVARVIIHLYAAQVPFYSSLPSSKSATKEGSALSQLLLGDQDKACVKELAPANYTEHLHIIVLVFALSDKLMIPELKPTCKRNFAAKVKNASDSELACATDLIYSQHSQMMGPLSVVVVYEWQKRVGQSMKSAAVVRRLVEAFPTFGADMAVICMRQKLVWCSVCKEEKPIAINECECGMTGQCRKGFGCSNLLKDGEIGLKSNCTKCKGVGTWRFEREEK